MRPDLSTAELDITSESFTSDPHRHYRELLTAGAAHRVRGGMDDWILVTDYSLARAVLKDGRFSKRLPARYLATSTGGAARPSMLGTDPPEHTRLKTAVRDHFSGRRLDRVSARILARTEAMLDDLEPSMKEPDGAELRSEFAMPLAFGTLAEILGVSQDEQTNLHTWTIRMLSPAASEAEAAEQATAVESIRALVASMVAHARDASGEVARDATGVVASLARDERPDALDDDEITTMVTLLLAAGYQGAANLVLNGLVALLTNLDQWELLVREPERVNNAVHEALRFDCPVQRATLRVVTEDVRLGDVEFREGDLVGVSLAASNRDPKQFTDPDTFDITRRPTPNLAYSHGTHRCLGAELGTVQARIALSALARRFPRMRLHPGHGVVEWTRTGFLRGPVSLWVTESA